MSIFYKNRVMIPVVILMVIGYVYLSSISMIISQKQHNTPFFYMNKQLISIVIGFMAWFIACRIPLSFWQRSYQWMLIVVMLLHVLLVIPGVGKHINGSTRWINLGMMNFQLSELAKLSMIIYMSGFSAFKNEDVRDKLFGFFKPITLLVVMAVLCLLQPDFGAMFVIVVSSSVVLFLAGARIRHFLMFIVMAGASMTILMLTSPYRVKRLTAFLDPWANPFSDGYQLTQALIAIGNGGAFGRGLGNGLQKMFYLPEAHTDFLFAAMIEESGMTMGLLVIFLFIWMGYNGVKLAKSQIKNRNWFGYYLCCGITFQIILQAFINIGVNMGLLPTKGITLPFISYGGSSILVLLFAMGIVSRCVYESKEI